MTPDRQTSAGKNSRENLLGLGLGVMVTQIHFSDEAASGKDDNPKQAASKSPESRTGHHYESDCRNRLVLYRGSKEEPAKWITTRIEVCSNICR